VIHNVGIKNKLGEIKWLPERHAHVNIVLSAYLTLFLIFERNRKIIITFPGVVYDPNKAGYEQQLENSLYENHKEDELIVEIYASRGRIKKKRLQKKIDDIVNEAKQTS
jgi:hypothetical protein